MPTSSLQPLPYRIVNAFTTDSPFSGNQAAVVILPGPSDLRTLDEKYMQSLATDFNLSETAFIVPLDVSDTDTVRYGLRWFTASFEVELCGHATLASAQVLFSIHPTAKAVHFETRFKGTLIATRGDDPDEIEISLPALPTDDTQGLGRVIDKEKFKEVLSAASAVQQEDIVDIVGFAWGPGSVIIELRQDIDLANLDFDIKILEGVVMGGILAITQRAESSSSTVLSIKSRVFCPGDAIGEDPVTGAAHAALIPYYLQYPSSVSRLSHDFPSLHNIAVDARQVSARGGKLKCTLGEGRVRLVGNGTEMGRGTLTVF